MKNDYFFIIHVTYLIINFLIKDAMCLIFHIWPFSKAFKYFFRIIILQLLPLPSNSNRLMRKKLLFCLHFFILIFVYSFSKANSIRSKGTSINGYWNDPSMWVGDAVPTNGDDVIISTTDIITVDNNFYPTIKSLTLNGTGRLILTNLSGLITVTGNLVVNTNATITMNGSISIYGDVTNFGNISCTSLSSTADLSIGNNLTNYGSITGNKLTLQIGTVGLTTSLNEPNYGYIGSRNNPIGRLSFLDTVNISVINADSIYCKVLSIYKGKLINSKKVVIGDGSFGQIEISKNAVLDTFPAYNISNNNLSVSYHELTSDYATGYEIPPSRVFRDISLTFSPSPKNVIISDGNITVNTIDFSFANGRKFILGNNDILCLGNIFSASKSTGYIVTDGNGALKRPIGPGYSVDYPIGASISSYDSVRLSFPGPGDDNDTFGVRVKGPDFNALPYDTSRVVKREWDITENTLGGNSANIFLTYDASAPKGMNYNPSQVVSIGHYKNGHWEELPATLTNLTAHAVSNSFSPFIIGNAGAILPVKLLSFNARRNVNNHIIVSWVVTNEINNKKFEIERSTNGINFNSIASIGARNNGSLTETYSYTDQQPIGNILYYRLKQIDINGTYSYSAIVTVKMNGKQTYNIYPNPVKDRIQIRQSIISNELNQVMIYDNKGNKVYQTVLNMNSGTGSVELSKLSAGNYIMQINNGESYTIPFLKQ